jgi:hypothetical protein
MTAETAKKISAAHEAGKKLANSYEHGQAPTTPPDPRQVLGAGAGWDERRAYEWGYLSVLYLRDGNSDRARYCTDRALGLEVAAARES